MKAELIQLTQKENELIEACLCQIDKELKRCFWNKNQKEMDSPFDNTGMFYRNNTFVAKAYDWKENIEPNFEYRGLKVYWYKYLGRGMSAYINKNTPLTTDFLATMIENCKKSIKKDFEEKH